MTKCFISVKKKKKKHKKKKRKKNKRVSVKCNFIMFTLATFHARHVMRRLALALVQIFVSSTFERQVVTEAAGRFCFKISYNKQQIRIIQQSRGKHPVAEI